MADNRKLAQGLMMMTPAMREDLAGREKDIQRGKTVELLRRAGGEMYNNPIVNTAIGMAPVLGDIQAGVEAYRSAQAGDWGNAGLNAAGMLPFIPMLGKTVWHGSPHTFDKFDLSKIGTGEGAQAYGHGLYLADAPETAKMYRDTLSKSDKQFYVKGNRVEPEMLDAFESNVLNAKGYGRNKQDYLEELEMNRVSPSAIQQMSKVWDEMGDVTVKEVLPENASLYKVDLPDEQIAKMLDWDKPLSEQPEVYSAIQKYAQETQGNPETAMRMLEGKTAGEAYQMWNQPEYVSQFLNEQGVPGIQYLDQASRGAGDGTRNYVVFSDEIPQILERNGTPLGNAVRNYGLEHRPMTIEGGAAPLHELTSSFGDDVYGKQALQFYGSGDPREKQALEIMKSVRGNPDAPVTIYRGVPEGVNQINRGDWVTVSPEVAADYGNVISQQVPASHITSWPDSLLEFGYYPPKAE